MTGDPAGAVISLISTPVLLILLLLLTRRLVRRRVAVNRALHEIRRPLQVLALGLGDGLARETSGAPPLLAATGQGSVHQAISALEKLDRELNRSSQPARRRRELIAARLMVDAAVRRLGPNARIAGREIEASWIGPDVLVRADGVELSAALDNLVLNAIEHGGGQITVECVVIGRKLRIDVVDEGRSTGGESRSANGVGGQPTKVGGSGHGLSIVEETVVDHGGRTDFCFSEAGSKASVVLPVIRGAGPPGSQVRVNW